MNGLRASFRTLGCLVGVGLVLATLPLSAEPSSRGNGEKAREFWSFRQPVASKPPKVTDATWPRCDIDRFVLAGLESHQLQPVADADRAALLRRLHFDLVGLPPPPAALDAFLQDQSPNALQTVVDDLLASPHFGERWGRHWLDVARFAESTGKEHNHTYPAAWRYRDYVIDAFNADLPYDQFIREQIAGDLLPASGNVERDRLSIATGFLALGPKSLNERRPEQFRMDVIDEQIDVTTRAVLGVTVACARCHDHKSDPFTQRDYYAMAGIFRSTRTCYGTTTDLVNRQPSTLLSLAESEPPAPVASQSFLARIERAKARRRAMLEKAAAAAISRIARPNQRTNRLAAPPIASPTNRTAQAMGVQEASPIDCRVLLRGELKNRGPRVERGVVQVLSPGASFQVPTGQSGRLQLADWLTARSNPLTARVLVNRIWLQLFGRGLVRTADDFGATGERPSHPELLDYLALEFMNHGWSVKQLIREIVLSRTYQLSSHYDDTSFAADPDNILLWRSNPRRLDAEAIRDAMLAASGQLDPAPLHGSIVAEMGDVFVGRGLRAADVNAPSNHRSVYLPVVRDCVVDALELFDFAEPSLVMAQRDTTTVPAQALYLMNNAFVLEQSAAFARRLLADSQATDRERIRTAYRLALGRVPSQPELERALTYVREAENQTIRAARNRAPRLRESAWTTFAQALFACAEFRYLH